MKFTATLSRYLARTYFLNMLLVLFSLLAVIYLFDTVELVRRASKHADVPVSLILRMGLLKLPETGQTLFPFAILFSAMYTFWQMTKRYELVVVRSAGFSVWQFLSPVIGVAVFVGLFQILIINPVGAVLVGQYEQLENTYLKRKDSEIAIFKEGLWLRQALAGPGQGYVILHAEKIGQPDWVLRNVSVLFFDGKDMFQRRVDAQDAVLEKGRWVLRDINLHAPPAQDRKAKEYLLPTDLTIQDIEESFSSPRTMSFWNLPGYIRTLEDTGFDATSLRVHYQTLLSQPLMFAAMILLAAAVSMRPPRMRGAFGLISIGVLIGFVVFFLSSFLQALGASGQIPTALAAWSPALVSFLFGLGVMMHFEDG